MNRVTLLGVGLGFVLAAALLTSRALLESPVDVPRTSVAVPPRAQVVQVEVARPVPQVAPAPAAVAIEVSSANEPELLTLPDDDNPFATESSVELDYAFDLVFGPNSTIATARVAAEVFERCIKQAPQNHRCHRGLVAAQQRQQPDWVPPPEPEAIAPFTGQRLHPRQIREPIKVPVPTR